MRPAFRISRGSFPAEKFQAVRAAFLASQSTLEPATRRLRGHCASYAAINANSGSIVYVSFWDDAEAAEQLGGLAEMQAAGVELIKHGVQFERPIITYETLWSVESYSQHSA